MRYAITHKNESTWIAQRNGRTKDGDDKTQVAVLKMFAMSSDKPFADNLAEMNISLHGSEMPFAVREYWFGHSDLKSILSHKR